MDLRDFEIIQSNVDSIKEYKNMLREINDTEAIYICSKHLNVHYEIVYTDLKEHIIKGLETKLDQLEADFENIEVNLNTKTKL
jgi:hypothetical protein